MPTPKPRQTDRDFVASLDRGLRILSAFERDEPELTLSEVAQKTGLTPATARRFLLTLKSLGYVGMNGRRFVLRPKVLDLAYSYLDSMNVDEALQPYLRELVQRTGDSSSVTVLEGTEIVYIANASVRRVVRLGAGVGSRFPAYPTAMGRVLLAYLPKEKLDVFFANQKFEMITEFTETNPDKIRKHLDKIRADGYGVVQDELEVGLVSLAVPLEGQLRPCVRRDELLVSGAPHRRQRDAAHAPRFVARVLDASFLRADALPRAGAFGGERTRGRRPTRRRPPPPLEPTAWAAAVLI